VQIKNLSAVCLRNITFFVILIYSRFEESSMEESSESGLDSDMDESEESPIMELWSDEEVCESEVSR
jgi:hypothetical protein